MKSCTAVFERDEDGVWIVTVPAVRGCHSSGRTLAEARRNIREALCLFVENADGMVLSEKFRLPAEARRVLAEYRQRERTALRAKSAADEAARKARILLRKRVGLPERDARALLALP